MQFHDAKLVGSCAYQSQWPTSNLPEVIFAGRSNAGKSSLINALCNRNQLAYSGKIPGKTRLLNFFEVDQRVMFCDSPGYGYAVGGSKGAKDFAALLDPYFAYRTQLRALVLVLDIRRIPNEDDQLMIDYAKQSHLAILIACVKSDKVSRSQQMSAIAKISKTLQIPTSSFIPCSSLKKEGIDQVWNKLNEILFEQ